jgi:hypothetical protein
MGDLKVELSTQYVFEISVPVRTRPLFLNETRACLDPVERSLLLLRGIDLQSLGYSACSLIDILSYPGSSMTTTTTTTTTRWRCPYD